MSYGPRPSAEEQKGRVEDAKLAGGGHQGLALGGKAVEAGDNVGGVWLGDAQAGESGDGGEDGETHGDG